MARYSVHLVLLLVQLCFATLPVAVKLALVEVSALTLALLRVGAAAVLFLLLQRLLVAERIRSAADYGRLALYALFGVVANQLLYLVGLVYTTATVAQTLITAGPALTLLVAIALRRETATPGKWLGIGLAAAGALYLIGVDLAGGSAFGNLLILVNVLCFSIFLVISRDMLQRYSPLTVVTWIFLFGALGIAPFGVPAVAVETGGVSATTWLVLAWIVAVPTVGAYYLNQWALQRVEASVVAVYVYLQPIGTALLAMPILGERPSAAMLPAVALIFLGVGITARASRRPTPPPGV